MAKPLLPARETRASLRASALALASLALLGIALLSSSSGGPSALDMTTTTVNCDGSVDISTYAPGVPCVPGIVPTTMSYTSYAPYVMQPPLAPTVLAPPPQPWGAAPVPVGPNAYQYATVWDGAHTLAGAQPEWAAEDAAQHALNMDNWRIKILKAKREQAKINGDIQQISGSYTDTERRRGLGGVGMGGRPQLEAASPDRQVLRRRADDSAELNSIQKSVAELAGETTKAIGALAREIDAQGKSSKKEREDTQALRRGTDEEIDGIMKQLSDLTYQSQDAADYDQ